jgi:serine/threonine protein phosphatase 1
VAESGRLFAVGDVHGCVDELERLLDALPVRADDTVVFVGDYIDRGPDSRGAVRTVLEWRRSTSARVVCLRGNHEDMALGFLGRAGRWGDAWLRNGGTAALRSYGIDLDLAPADVEKRFPADHVVFFESLGTSYRWNDYLVVHAGIRPGVALELQTVEDLLWIRDEFLRAPHDLGMTVLFGHTPHRAVAVDLPYRIGIDTGCVYGGALTCLALPDGTLYQVRRGDRTVRRSALPSQRSA